MCNIDCIFCAFYRHPGEKDTNRLSIDQLIQKFREAAANSITIVILQGGVDPAAIPFEYYLEFIERTVKEVPAIFPHFFSMSEIIVMSQVSGLSIQGVLEKLWEKGLRVIPGDSAEILSDRF